MAYPAALSARKRLVFYLDFVSSFLYLNLLLIPSNTTFIVILSVAKNPVFWFIQVEMDSSLRSE
jgi:hypothetical protein